MSDADPAESSDNALAARKHEGAAREVPGGDRIGHSAIRHEDPARHGPARMCQAFPDTDGCYKLPKYRTVRSKRDNEERNRQQSKVRQISDSKICRRICKCSLALVVKAGPAFRRGSTKRE